MKYILQKILKTKAKDISIHGSMQEAADAAKVLGLDYVGTSYIGVFPNFVGTNKGIIVRYRIVLEHPMGMICSPSHEEISSVFGSVVASIA